MGCLQSAPVASTDAQTNEVDKELHDAALREQNHFKILLLGTGESGKSTVVKQVKLIYNKGGLTDKEKAEAAQAIRRNCIECMQTLSEAMAALAIPLGDEGLADARARVAGLDSDATLTPQLATDVESLWRDSGVQTCYERRSEYWLLDASSYYFENAQRLAEEDFSPTDEDVIMTRVRTTGIAVTEFNDGPYHYSLVDVGGQRSERRKWIHCFDDVKAVIFLEGLSGYHQVLFEDATQNRMHESLELFEQVVSNPIFEKIPVFVFLNKKDLFEEMIVKVSLKVCFPEYSGVEGEGAAGPALDYISAKYKAIMEKKCPGKPVHIQIIAARVRMDMKVAFAEVKDQIRSMYAVKK